MSTWRRIRFDVLVAGSVLAFLVVTGTVVYRVSGYTSTTVAAEQARMEFDFEDGEEVDRSPLGWFSGGQEGGYQVRAVEDRVRTGKWAAKIGLVDERGYEAFGVFGRCVDAESFVGTTVRYHGFIATEDVDGTEAGMWLRAEAGDKAVLAFDNMIDRPLRGTADFTQHEIVLDIPVGSARLCFGTLLAGSGTLWADDFVLESIASIGTGRPVTATLQSELSNGGFEGGTWPAAWPKGWNGGGEPAYALTVAADAARSGTVARLRHVRDMRDDQAGTLGQCIYDVAEMAGRVVTLTAWTRTQDVTGRVKVQLSALRHDREDALVDVHTPDAGLSGTTPWQRHELTHEIPADAHSVCVAVEMTGTGTVDVDDVVLEARP